MVLLQTVLQDLRYALRTLFRRTAFTVVAVLTLATGIGVNDVALTAYEAVFNRPLEARDSGRMVNLALILHTGAANSYFSYPDYEACRDRLRSLSGLVAYAGGESVTIAYAGSGAHNPKVGSQAKTLGLLPSSSTKKELASAIVVSENYFQVLGIQPLHGRTFGSASELAASPAAIISENYWQRRFSGDPALLGQTIRLNGAAFTIVGITPRDFVGTGYDVPDFWLPLSLEPLLHHNDSLLRDRDNHCCRLFGRLAPGATIDQAQAEMTVLANQLSGLHDPNSNWSKPATAIVWPGSPLPLPMELMPGTLKYAILLIMVAVGSVLVIACANVATLQLARATSRQNELRVRLALGASRARLVRLLLTECGLLGVLAGAIALPSTWILLRVLANAASQAFPSNYGTTVFYVNPDLEIFAFVFAIAVSAGVLMGLTPALESSRTALFAAANLNPTTSPVRSRRIRAVFIAGQVAVALPLLIAGSMLIHSSIHALKVDRGYDINGTVAATLRFPEDAKFTAERKLDLVRQVRARLAALPGVVAETSADTPMFGYLRAAVSLNGETPTGRNTWGNICYSYVQPDYFQTLDIPLLAGRNFPSHSGDAEPFAIISESAAKRLWPGQNPIGRSLRLGTNGQFHRKQELLPDGPLYLVIGVAGDTRGATFDDSDSVLVYLPLPANRLQDYPILIRTRSGPGELIHSLRPLIASIDPDLELDAQTFHDMLRQTPTFLGPAFAAAIASQVGLIGLLLASAGIFGTVSYIVVLRTREVGIRMALGAEKRHIMGLMLAEVTKPVLAGSLVGIVLAAGASRLLRGVLHGLSTVDAVSFAGISALFLAAALLATWLPSRRAMRVEPIEALRYQ